ncbi:MAG: hypothetical protein N2688_00905 [Burkholderiaceae bacterium]|nr:hypothetical protein [Burkholderiaceae bacterium]
MSATEKSAAGPKSFADNFSDGLQAMQRLWQALGVPQSPEALKAVLTPQGLLAPTLDVAELDKRIADLRAVEQWLALNANMLRATIQTLEVQRNTIATLKAFGGALSATGPAAAPPPAAAAPAQRAAAPSPHSAREAADAAPSSAAAALDPSVWWSALQDQFVRIAAAASIPPEQTKTRRPRRRAARP